MRQEVWKRILFRLIVVGFHAARGSRIATYAPLRGLWKRSFDFARPRGLVSRKIHGSVMYLDGDDQGLGYAILLGAFEPFETDLFAKCVQDRMTVVDAGANIGYYALLAAQRVGKKGQVFAIEPSPAAYRVLLQNIAVNHYENVIHVRECLSDSSGVSRLGINRRSPGESGMLPLGEAEPVDSIAVQTVALDDLLLGRGVDVLKMDIEGAEGLALMGATRLLHRDSPVIFMEFVPDLLERMGTPATEVLKMLRDHGYSVFLINERGRSLLRVRGMFASSGNLLCVPASRNSGFLRELGCKVTE